MQAFRIARSLSPLLLALLLSAAHAHDVVEAAPQHHKALMENETVRVLETRIAAGERTPVHTRQWPASLYVVSWSDFIRYDPSGNVLLDSRTMATTPKPGEALWSPPGVAHSIHNVGTTGLLVIAVEIKQPHALDEAAPPGSLRELALRV